MSLKSALVAFQQEKKEKEITARIQAMINEQKRLLGEGCVNNSTKVKKEWNENILTDGGVSYYKLSGKRYKVSVCDGDNDVVLKFTIKDAMSRLVSVSAGTLKEAQQAIDSIYGTSKDGKHKYTLSACRV